MISTAFASKIRRPACLNGGCPDGQTHCDPTLFSLAHVGQAATLATSGVELPF
jgi:hypothetical protein